MAKVLTLQLHFHFHRHGNGYDHDTNWYADYGHVSFVSTYAVSVAIFPPFKENIYATAYESVYGIGRIVT